MLHNINKLILALLLIPSLAFAQALPIRNDSDANLRDLGSNLQVGRNFSVDQAGRQKFTLNAGTAGITNPILAEDTPFPNLQAMMMVGYQLALNLSTAGAGDDDAAMVKIDGLNRLYVNTMGDGPSGTLRAVSAADITDTTSTQLVAAAGASTRIHVRDISCSNTSAVASRIDFLDGATVIWTGLLPAVAVGGQYRYPFVTELRGTANTAFNVQLATTATATRCAVAYFLAND